MTMIRTALRTEARGNKNAADVLSRVNDFVINDVNVTLNIQHTWVPDLTITLTSPDGTVVELSSAIGNAGDDDMTNTSFDDGADTDITDGTAPFTGVFRPVKI